MNNNFYIYKDKGGKIPQLRYSAWQCRTHPYFVQYVNNRPVKYHGPIDVVSDNVNRDAVWCYDTHNFIPTNSLEVI